MSIDPNQMKPATFLIVDDDKVALKAIRRGIENLRLVNPVATAGDGLEALEYLRGELDPAGRLPPHIVLLDLNMPRMTGHEFLDVIRADPHLKRLVVFVITTSDEPRDVAAAYDRQVAGYIVKEEPMESLRNALEVVGAYSTVVLLP